MTTSGSTSWSYKQKDIVYAALRKLGVLIPGEDPTTNQKTTAISALNALIKSLIADGLQVWKLTSTVFTAVGGINLYQIGLGKTINTPMPMKVVQALRAVSGQANIPMNLYTNYNFNLLPSTATQGTPVNLYYHPIRDYGIISLWPTPQDSSNTITLLYQAPLEDMVSDTDDLDFPSYWDDAIVYLLATRLAPEYGIPLPDRQQLLNEAKEMKAIAMSYDVEEGSMYFQPDWSGKY